MRVLNGQVAQVLGTKQTDFGHASRPALNRPAQPRQGRVAERRRSSLRPLSYNGRPFSRSGSAGQDFLEDVFSAAVDAFLPRVPPNPTSDMPRPLAVDFVETDYAYEYHADIPGVEKPDLKVQMKDGALTISGKRTAPAGVGAPAATDIIWRTMRKQERQSGKFHRQIQLPEDADWEDQESINARVSEGVLKVTIDKQVEDGLGEDEDEDEDGIDINFD